MIAWKVFGVDAQGGLHSPYHDRPALRPGVWLQAPPELRPPGWFAFESKLEAESYARISWVGVPSWDAVVVVEAELEGEIYRVRDNVFGSMVTGERLRIPHGPYEVLT